MPAALVALASFELDEAAHEGALFVVPLGLDLGDDLPRISNGDLVAIAVVAALDGARLPSMESLRRYSEVAGEAESANLERSSDKALRNL